MDKRLTVICGAFGSGKTEFALSYAFSLKEKDPVQPVAVVDLDIVNPYFRSRDVAKALAGKGMKVVSSATGMEYSDIPALSPEIYGLLQNKACRVIFDVGGDPSGARALGRFESYFHNQGYQMLLVLNPFRPDTRNVAAATDMIAGIERASRLKVTGLVSNINLGAETTLELWRSGLQMIEEVAAASGLPLIYHAVEGRFLDGNRAALEEFALFPLTLRMLVPWLVDF
jgi:DNA helicase HerA-like ATPase